MANHLAWKGPSAGERKRGSINFAIFDDDKSLEMDKVSKIARK